MKTKYNVTTVAKNVCNFGYILAAILLMLFASACSIGGKSKPSHFYMLDSHVENMGTKKLSDLRMGVGPITIPGYIDRPQIVTKTESAELQLAEFDRWAEPMEGMFTRTLAANIRSLTGSPRIHSYPWSSTLEFTYRINAKVIKFENNANGDALLVVHWQLTHDKEISNLKTMHSEFNASAINTSYSARVAALNDTLAQFAKSSIILTKV